MHTLSNPEIVFIFLKLKFSPGYIGSINTKEFIYTWKFKHVGIKYDCGQCDYKGAEHSKLKYHQQRKHEGVQLFFTTLCRVKNIQNLSITVLAITAIWT